MRERASRPAALVGRDTLLAGGIAAATLAGILLAAPWLAAQEAERDGVDGAYWNRYGAELPPAFERVMWLVAEAAGIEPLRMAEGTAREVRIWVIAEYMLGSPGRLVAVREGADGASGLLARWDHLRRIPPSAPFHARFEQESTRFEPGRLARDGCTVHGDPETELFGFCPHELPASLSWDEVWSRLHQLGVFALADVADGSTAITHGTRLIVEIRDASGYRAHAFMDARDTASRIMREANRLLAEATDGGR